MVGRLGHGHPGRPADPIAPQARGALTLSGCRAAASGRCARRANGSSRPRAGTAAALRTSAAIARPRVSNPALLHASPRAAGPTIPAARARAARPAAWSPGVPGRGQAPRSRGWATAGPPAQRPAPDGATRASAAPRRPSPLSYRWGRAPPARAPPRAPCARAALGDRGVGAQRACGRPQERRQASGAESKVGHPAAPCDRASSGERAHRPRAGSLQTPTYATGPHAWGGGSPTAPATAARTCRRVASARYAARQPSSMLMNEAVQRRASAAAGRGSDVGADAGGSQLHAFVSRLPISSS